MQNEVMITEGANFGYVQGSNNSKLHTIGNEFKNWIEGTPLFRAIKKHAGTGLIIESLPACFQLQLNGINKIDKAEDLPIELIQNFYINSPFYINNQEKQNLTNNESTSEESLW